MNFLPSKMDSIVDMQLYNSALRSLLMLWGGERCPRKENKTKKGLALAAHHIQRQWCWQREGRRPPAPVHEEKKSVSR
jgi:hypothetical protein